MFTSNTVLPWWIWIIFGWLDCDGRKYDVQRFLMSFCSRKSTEIGRGGAVHLRNTLGVLESIFSGEVPGALGSDCHSDYDMNDMNDMKEAWWHLDPSWFMPFFRDSWHEWTGLQNNLKLHSKDVEPGDLLTSMDASLVVQCSFSKEISSAKPHETSRMVWSFGGLGNKNPKKSWRHGKREEVGFMWIRMLLGCISTSVS